MKRLLLILFSFPYFLHANNASDMHHVRHRIKIYLKYVYGTCSHEEKETIRNAVITDSLLLLSSLIIFGTSTLFLTKYVQSLRKEAKINAAFIQASNELDRAQKQYQQALQAYYYPDALQPPQPGSIAWAALDNAQEEYDDATFHFEQAMEKYQETIMTKIYGETL